MLYIVLFSPNCPFEINTTHQYSVTPEACITARKPIQQGFIKSLTGVLVAIDKDESDLLDVTGRNFSIVASSRKRYASLFLGPGRFVNHDCSANSELRLVNSVIQVIAMRYIRVGEEITVNYGRHYFGKDNRDCLCMTCARNGHGAARSTCMEQSTRLRKLESRDRFIPVFCAVCASHHSECSRCLRHFRLFGSQWPNRR